MIDSTGEMLGLKPDEKVTTEIKSGNEKPSLIGRLFGAILKIFFGEGSNTSGEVSHTQIPESIREKQVKVTEKMKDEDKKKLPGADDAVNLMIGDSPFAEKK